MTLRDLAMPSKGLVLLGVGLLNGCTATSAPGDSGASDASMNGMMDGASRDAPIWARDFGPLDFGGADDGVCRPGPGLCNTHDDCVAWAAAVGPAGAFVHTVCAQYHCQPGDTCTTTSEGRVDCNCAGTTCEVDEICVSDTPGGTPRCTLECVGH